MTAQGARRVAVTGIGVVSALGNSLEEFYRAREMAAALMPFTGGVIPPTAHLDEPDPAGAVRHVPMTAERGEIPRAVMSNSFAFGGSNVVLIAERA